MPPRRKEAKEADEIAAAPLPGVMEARRRRRRRRSRRRRSRGRRRSRSRSRSHAASRSPSASSRASSMANSAGSPSPSPVRRRARSTKYGNVNAFLNFMSSERARMGGATGGRTAAALAKELGARWRAMPLEERQPYIAQAIKSREELERTSPSSNIVNAARGRRRRRRGRRSKGRGRGSRSRRRRRR